MDEENGARLTVIWPEEYRSAHMRLTEEPRKPFVITKIMILMNGTVIS